MPYEKLNYKSLFYPNKVKSNKNPTNFGSFNIFISSVQFKVGFILYSIQCENHCVKSVRMRYFSGPYFPALGLNTEKYFRSECGKILTRKTPNTDTFHAVNSRLYRRGLSERHLLAVPRD